MAPLDEADISAVKASIVGKLLLRKTQGFSTRAKRPAESPCDIRSVSHAT